MAVERHYTLRQLTELLGHSREFWRLHAGAIPGTLRIGKAILVPSSGLEQFLAEHRVDCRREPRAVRSRR